MRVNLYYDWTWVPGKGGALTSDTEGNLVQLCQQHAAVAIQRGQVSKAANGDEESHCEYDGCEVRNGDEVEHA